MNLAIAANALTMILCAAVLIQSVRMMRSLRTVKDGALTEVVAALEKATGQARLVLADMKKTLSTDYAQNARMVEQARELSDELSVMTGIAESACERIVNAVGLANANRPSSEESDGEPMIDDDATIDEGTPPVATVHTLRAEAA
ncbi:DUF6468 domain-containing protein [Sphingomonas sp. CJ20]